MSKWVIFRRKENHEETKNQTRHQQKNNRKTLAKAIITIRKLRNRWGGLDLIRTKGIPIFKKTKKEKEIRDCD